MSLRDLITRALVVLKAAPAWIMAASTIVTVAADEIVAVLPDQYDGIVAERAAQIVAVLAGIVAIVRQVTPVAKSARGLLPKD